MLLWGINSLNEESFNKSGDIILNKPRFGLYGSTLVADRYGNKKTGWLDFVYNEDFRINKYKCGISYTLHKKTKIYTISNLDDYLNLLNNYKMIKYEKICIDWNKFKSDYDAFHLTLDAFWELRIIWADGYFDNKKYRIDDFYSYDCETWIIFNLNCINKGSIHNISIDYKYNMEED